MPREKPPTLPISSITAPDAILGSPLYMSPEQLESAKHVDARTDIWSLGVVLYELLTGRPPFAADSYLAIAAKIAASAPADLRAGCPEAPEGLAAVVRRCLEKRAAQRFQSIAELAQALAPYTPGHPRAAPTRRRGVLLVGLGAAAVLGAGLLATRGTGGTSVPRDPEGPLTAAATRASTVTRLASPAPSPAPPHPVDAGVKASSAAPSSSAPPPPPRRSTSTASARPRRSTAPREGSRRTTPAVAGPRSHDEQKPADAVDPMDPALLER
jgi:serine/threonine-protein kinase